MEKINFYAGPAILPDVVLKEAQEAVGQFAGTGLSILEISHRSKEFVEVMEEARNHVRDLMQLKSDYEVLFLQGGALSQFHMVPMNLLNEDETAAYFDTGTWAHGALEEARLFGQVHIACSSRGNNYSHIPKNISIPDKLKYLHITSNNTIFGTQLSTSFMNSVRSIVPSGSFTVCDMSSDIFSRQIDYSNFDLIYAGAQKNMGPAGTVLVVVNKKILGTVRRKLPKMLDYFKHIEGGSMLNTPSVFAVYVTCLTLRWIKSNGIHRIEKDNAEKASLLYNAIDNSQLFTGTTNKEDRSQMNVCFRLKTSDTKNGKTEDAFLKFAEARGLLGLKGHRSVGGFRASVYNAMKLSGVRQLTDAIKDFEQV